MNTSNNTIQKYYFWKLIPIEGELEYSNCINNFLVSVYLAGVNLTTFKQAMSKEISNSFSDGIQWYFLVSFLKRLSNSTLQSIVSTCSQFVLCTNENAKSPVKSMTFGVTKAFLRWLEHPTYRLGVKFRISTQIQHSPCGLSKCSKMAFFEPLISLWGALRPPCTL